MTKERQAELRDGAQRLAEDVDTIRLARPMLELLDALEAAQAELERVKPLAEIGERWQADSSLEAWFPMTAEKLLMMEAKVRACGDAAANDIKQQHELERVKEQVRWRPYPQETPIIDGDYIVCGSLSGNVRVDYWTGKKWHSIAVDSWMPFPLPEPPKGEGK